MEPVKPLSKKALAHEKHDVPLPFTAARRFVALGVANGWGNPVAVFLIVPLLRLLSICGAVRTGTLNGVERRAYRDHR